MPENNDYSCKVCGKHFSEEDDYKNHGKQDHPEVNEAYPDLFDKKEEPREEKEAEEFDWSEVPEEEWDDVVLRKVNGDKEEEEPAEEIDQQEDKPIQTHDDWQKELEGLKDEYSTEDVNDCAICNSTEHPTSEHPVTAQEDEKEDEQRDMANDLNKPYDLVPKIPEPWEYGGADYKREGDPDGDKAEEEGGADDPLSKVADLAESYRFLSRDKRSTLFETLGFGQGDSAVLAGLEWNELTRPIKVEASEAFAKEEEEEVEKEEDPDANGNEDEAYEALYNLEKNHASPDYKKKAIECSRCNEKFYNFNDRSVHFNEVHVNAREYELPDQCPFCKEFIQEPETLDWHMQEQHGANVPSQFTQTGVSAGMADTDYDSLESHKATEAKWECLDCDQKFDDAGKHQDETGHHNIARSHADEGQGGTYGRSDFMLNPQHEDITTCVVCGRDIDSHANPNTDYRGMRGDAPATDHYFLGGDQGGSDDKYDFESYAGESRSASDLRQEIRKQKEFINMASFENPLNMGDAEDKLHNLESELESLGGEELEFTETFGDYEVDCDCDKDPNCPKCKGKGTTTWTSSVYQGDEGEGGHQDLDDTTEYPDDPEEEQEKAEEDNYVDDSDNAGEKYVCPDCDEEFNSDEQLEGHQYSYYHGKHKDEGEGEDMPRNEIGGY